PPPATMASGLAAAGELLAELLDAAGFDDPLLGAGVERMRFRGDVKLEERILLAVLHLDLLAARHGGAGDELEPARHVLEHHFAVFGVDAFFHVWLAIGATGKPAIIARRRRPNQDRPAPGPAGPAGPPAAPRAHGRGAGTPAGPTGRCR